VANTAQFLAMSGRRVVALDLDLEAPGLHQKLGNRDVWRRTASGGLAGAVDELLAILENEPRNRTLRQTAIEVDLPLGTSGSLVLIPAGSAPSHAYWAALERLNNTLRTQRQNGRLPEAVL
jgi:MinD-like ATPase involved in chromosome partitioning or flagellar assembly